MNKILIVISEYHLKLYKNGFLDYAKQKNIVVSFFSLYDSNIENFYSRKAYKYNLFSKRDLINQKQLAKFRKIINEYDKCLFINLTDESRMFIKIIPEKVEKNILFVDTIKELKKIDELRDFKKIFSFEYGDVDYAERFFNIKVVYVPIGTSYYLYKTKDRLPKYDISFVCLATEKRLEYLDKIAHYCQENSRTLFLGGHFWHNSNFLQRIIGAFRFRKKYPVLYKYVNNKYLTPNELAQVYIDSKICLNINIEKHHSFNTRNFDIMVLERLLVTDNEDLSGIEILPDQEFIMSSDPEDMIEKIDRYLSDDLKRKKIAQQGKIKVRERYCLLNTMEKILE